MLLFGGLSYGTATKTLAVKESEKCRRSGVLGIIFSEKSQVHRGPQMAFKAKKPHVPYMLKYCLRVPNVTPFWSTIARFPDN